MSFICRVWQKIIFAPELPKETPDLIYLCFPNNPTGSTIMKEQLQEWVDYANKVGAVIIYDAAYEAYISQEDVPHTIYECDGARACAIELRSFSKNAGFTGVRLGFTVIPKELKCGETSLHSLWARRHGTKYNGAPYIVQRAGEAVYSAAGKAQLKEQVAYYMRNAKYILEGLKDAGYNGIRRCRCALYLAESAQRNEQLGVFRLSSGKCQCSRNARLRVRPKRGDLFQADSFWKLRKYSGSSGKDKRSVDPRGDGKRDVLC